MKSLKRLWPQLYGIFRRLSSIKEAFLPLTYARNFGATGHVMREYPRKICSISF
jgi:hypothetical protein